MSERIIIQPYIDVTNPSKLTDQIWLSGAFAAREHDRLRELGITAIVNLTPDDFGGEAAGFKMHQVKIEDCEPIAPKHIAGFLQQMKTWLTDGEVVLIHCGAGISRTAAFTIAYLMSEDTDAADLYDMFERAHDRVWKARHIVRPHDVLKESVIAYFAKEPK